MKVTLASDVHFEFHKNEPNWLPKIAKNCDLIILAGDIEVGVAAIDSVLRIADAHPQSQLIFVAGNHEFYRQNIEKQLEHYRQAFSKNTRVHFLENNHIEINGYHILGCTLWTGFNILGDDKISKAMDESRLAIADFSLIRCGKNNREFAPQDAAARHEESCRWLISELEQLESQKTIIVTHFPPCAKARNTFFKQSLLTPYFLADCQQIIFDYQPLIWCYGHNHLSDDFVTGKTRVVSNQLGYPNEPFDCNYNTQKIIDLLE